MSAPTSAACSNRARELETPQSSSVTSSAPITCKPGRRELRPALDLEQRVRVGDDLVSSRPRAKSTALVRCRPSAARSGYPVGARGVAQPGSALRSGRRGPQFESGHPDCPQVRDPPGADPAPCRIPRRGSSAAAPMLGGVLRAVIFDVDFTLSRPGPELGPEAYRSVGAATGSSSTLRATRRRRLAAFADLRTHPELVHDEEIWIAFTEDIVRGMGGDAAGARACAVEIVRRWEDPRQLRPLRRCRARARGDAAPRPPDRADLERPARPRGVRPPPPARRRRRGRLEEPRPHEAPRLDLRERALRRSGSRRPRR